MQAGLQWLQHTGVATGSVSSCDSALMSCKLGHHTHCMANNKTANQSTHHRGVKLQQHALTLTPATSCRHQVHLCRLHAAGTVHTSSTQPGRSRGLLQAAARHQRCPGHCQPRHHERSSAPGAGRWGGWLGLQLGCVHRCMCSLHMHRMAIKPCCTSAGAAHVPCSSCLAPCSELLLTVERQLSGPGRQPLSTNKASRILMA